MLRLVESDKGKSKAQKVLQDSLMASWRNRERRVVVWRPGSEELPIYHNRAYWFASARPHYAQATRRYWNSIGRYSENGNLQITVEINVPMGSNSRRVAGFFAYDDQSEKCYLMHDGGVGGGRSGVGRASFLAWSGARLVEVRDSAGSVRHGIIVTPVSGRSVGRFIARFSNRVADFKAAVRRGWGGTESDREAMQTFRDYFKEFSGRKRGKRAREFEYITHHGDIVDALSEWRKRLEGKEGGKQPRHIKNAYIDLGIEYRRGSLAELYEVKTNADRQTLYTAIGQVSVYSHSGNREPRKYIVLPKPSVIPHDIKKALKHLGIGVIYFRMAGKNIDIIG